MNSTDKPWLSEYPKGVPAEIDLGAYTSLVDLLQESFQRFHDQPAFSFLGRSLTYAELDRLSQVFAAYLQSLGLVFGDRVAIMLPNTLQYPIAVAAILRAGCVVVNINPLYTPRELALQLKDSGAKTIVVLENFGATLQECLAHTDVQHVVLCAMGDCLGWFKGMLVNYALRHVKKMVPAFSLPTAIRFNDALVKGETCQLTPPRIQGDDLAVLQYTGGTTGISKGAQLLHRNLVANVLQASQWCGPALKRIPKSEQPTFVCVLPLYHIFAFNLNLMSCLRMGGCSVLIPNARDIAAVCKELAKHRFHIFPAVNTLFNGLVNHPDFAHVDWSHLVVSLGGGTAVQSAVAKRWLEKTGCPICEAYGLSETSPAVSSNPVTGTGFQGTVGLPLPSTEMKIIDDEGNEVPIGEIGEIAIRGPQVMAGYWQRPDETARVMTSDGFFKSGDIGVMDVHGYFHIVDRKKDMILVSGFNVYPNEVEEVVAAMAGVLECGVIGIADERSGEAVKVVVVKKDPELTQAQVLAHCKQNLTGYKIPRVVEFRTELPKTPIGKVLRRELRGATPA